MNDETTAAGWVVQVTISGPAMGIWRGLIVEGPSSFQFFNVAIGSPNGAVEAVRQKAGVSKDAPIRVVRSLSVPELAAARLRSGQIRPA